MVIGESGERRLPANLTCYLTFMLWDVPFSYDSCLYCLDKKSPPGLEWSCLVNHSPGGTLYMGQTYLTSHFGDSQGEGPHPFGNTGAQPTSNCPPADFLDSASRFTLPTTNRVLIDWCQFTFPDSVALEDVFVLLGGEFSTLDFGRHGYHSGYQRGYVSVYADGLVGMGTHVIASGKGCRQLEFEGCVTDWSAFFLKILDMGGHFTRLDVAFDDFEGKLDMEKILDSCKGGLVVSRFGKKGSGIPGEPSRGPRVHVEFDLDMDSGSNLGMTVRFGSKKSKTQVIFYDKAAEQGLDSELHWVRCEMRFRDLRASAVACDIINDGIGVVSGVLRAYLDFKVRSSTDSNRWRWSTVDWWESFLGYAEKMTLSLPGVVRTLKRSLRWLFRQVATTAAMFEEINPVFLREVVQYGREHLGDWHRDMIRLVQGGGDGSFRAWEGALT